MAEDQFKEAVSKNRIPTLTLDNKWHRLLQEIGETKEMRRLQDELNDLIKRQGKITTEEKDLKKIKNNLMSEIMKNKNGTENGADKLAEKKLEESSRLINEINERLEEYYDDFGSDAYVLGFYGIGIVLQGNDTMLVATHDEDGVITEIEVFSEKLCLENGIHVGLSSETMASKYNASFFTTDYFAGEAWMCYNVNGLPKNIILWATNIFDLFGGYPGTPTNGEHINDDDCFFQYIVPMDIVKDSRVKSICIKEKEYESFHPKE